MIFTLAILGVFPPFPLGLPFSFVDFDAFDVRSEYLSKNPWLF